MTDKRDDDGRFQQEYPDETFLQAVDSVPVASTQNIADEVGCSYHLAYHRLKSLEEEDVVQSEEVGRAFVWLRVD